MLGWWGKAVIRLRWWALAAAVALVGAGATRGAGVFGASTGGGQDDPNSQSNRAAAGIAAASGQGAVGAGDDAAAGAVELVGAGTAGALSLSSRALRAARARW